VIAVGILLSKAHHRIFGELTQAAETLGYESVWLGEHVVVPMDAQGELTSGGEDRSGISPTMPILDLCAVLSWLAGLTSRIRLGTFVYLPGLRHPFVAARALTTVDILSGGRLEAGLGAGWIRTEWEAVGADFAARGRCLEESIEVCRRLWTEPIIEHHGEFYDFRAVAFEPKPMQSPLPIAIGGESRRSLARAVRLADGWMGMHHSVATAARQVARLRQLETGLDRAGRRVRVTVVGELTDTQPLAAWEAAGVDRLIVHPWRHSRDAIDGITRLAAAADLPGRKAASTVPQHTRGKV
jgi:probable F420-dependent oxidoreductase